MRNRPNRRLLLKTANKKFPSAAQISDLFQEAAKILLPLVCFHLAYPIILPKIMDFLLLPNALYSNAFRDGKRRIPGPFSTMLQKKSSLKCEKQTSPFQEIIILTELCYTQKINKPAGVYALHHNIALVIQIIVSKK